MKLVETGKKKLGGAVYILPNLLTTGNLFFGFFSIVKSLQGNFIWAGSAILLASVFDMLDGRVARITGGTSEFGVQYDSLCDLVSFGLAPAFLMYQFGLDQLGRIGWIICFLFLACGALRLARFNVQSAIGSGGDDFTGLPIPMAAALIATFVSAIVDLESGSSELSSLSVFQSIPKSSNFKIYFLCIISPFLSFMMVSNVAYRSHKSLKIKGIKPFKLLSISVAILGFIAYMPELFGFLFFFVYAISGILEWALGWKKPTNDDDIFEDGEPQRDGRPLNPDNTPENNQP